MRPAQYLVIDADDTLWENNIYFEQAFDEFVDYLNHSHLTAAQIRAVLDEVEMVNNKVHGYGSANFGRNMVECYRHLAEREIGEEDLRRVMSFAERIVTHPMELIDGVRETLEALSARHHLTLFTKGHPEEQQLKVDRSGLGNFFQHIGIVREKDEAAYRQLAQERTLDVERTWMIGNSPKSDINPSLAAGFNAVYVHHPRTWHLEKTDLAEGPGQLLKLDRFPDLLLHF